MGRFARLRPWGERCFLAGLALLMVLSEVFSSNIQTALPSFSHLARLGLTGGAVVLLAAKCLLLTAYPLRWQRPAAAAVLAYTAFAAWYGDDVWFFLAALVGLGAYGVDLKKALRVYLFTAAAGLLLVQALHYATPLVPFKYYARNWDFGYGHYNGYGARLLGVFAAWGWLRHGRLRLFDWAGLAALLVYTCKVPGSRGAAGAMAVLLALLALERLLPALFRTIVWRVAVTALPAGLFAFSLYAGYVYNPEWPYDRMALLLLSIFLSGRFEIWHNVFWSAPLSLLGGLTTDGDLHHAMDNAYLAVVMNKGFLGAALLAVLLLVLLWRLGRGGHSAETLVLAALMLYWLMENKPFLLTANPALLLLPCVLLTPRGAPLPVLCGARAEKGADAP